MSADDVLSTREHLLLELALRLRTANLSANVIYNLDSVPFVSVSDPDETRRLRVEVDDEVGGWTYYYGKEPPLMKQLACEGETEKATLQLVHELADGAA